MNNKNICFSVAASLVLLFGAGCTKRPGQAPTAGDSQTGSALAQLQAAAEKEPSYNNFIALGLEYDRQKNAAEAVNAYLKAAEIDPKPPYAWNNACAGYNTLGRFADAIPLCEKAIQLDPKMQLAKNNLDLAQKNLVEQKKSLKKQKDLALSDPNVNSQLLVDLGLSLYNARELEASVEIWSKVKKDDQLYAVAQNNLASSYILLKKYSSAERAIEEALKLDPANPRFANNKKWLETARQRK